MSLNDENVCLTDRQARVLLKAASAYDQSECENGWERRSLSKALGKLRSRLDWKNTDPVPAASPLDELQDLIVYPEDIKLYIDTNRPTARWVFSEQCSITVRAETAEDGLHGLRVHDGSFVGRLAVTPDAANALYLWPGAAVRSLDKFESG